MAGVGFGVFQSLNRRAVIGMDVYMATFAQLLISSLVLAGASLATEDVNLLLTAPLVALLNFALAGFIHFFVGWTFLNASQKRIGAARTSPLIGTTPLFAAVIAALTLGEVPGLVAVAGIGLVVGGVYLISNERIGSGGSTSQTTGGGLPGAALGLSAAFCWALSPIFIRAGLEGLPSPLLGVTVGIIASAAAYGFVIAWQRKRLSGNPIAGEAWLFKFAAAVLVGLSTWVRWIALDLAPVAVVLAVTMLSVPTVMMLSPVVSGKNPERVTAKLWLGAGLIVGGALVLIWYR